MGNVNQSFNDRVRYFLQHPSISNVKIKEPDGWNDDEKEYARNEDYHGIFAKFSNSLKFVGKSAELINEIVDRYGIQTNLRLTKDERHPHTDKWMRSYDGYLDLSTWTKEKKFTSVKFNSGGLEEVLKSRESEDVELERLTSIDGATLLPITTEKVELDGRRIFLKSSMEAKAPDNNVLLGIDSKGNPRWQTKGIPLNIINKSHEELSEITVDAEGNDTNGSANEMFFLVSEVDRILNIKLDITFKTDCTLVDDVNWGYYQVRIAKYQNGSSLDYADSVVLLNVEETDFYWKLGSNNPNWVSGFYDANPPYQESKSHTISYTGIINVSAGQSLSLEAIVVGDLGSNTTVGHIRINTNNVVGNLFIDEDSVFLPTTSKLLLPHEVGDRLIEIMTGKKGILKSKFLGRTDLGYSIDGPGAFSGLAHGFWIRGFDALPIATDDNQNRFKPLTTSWKDFINSFDAVWNIGIGIEKEMYNENIVIEDLKYFYNRNITIKLPNQVKNVKRTISSKHYYSGIEVGYEKGGNYEEATGLDEYNGKSTFTTLIKVIKQKFIKVSKYRADSYGKEFCRRKPSYRYATQDTSYDDDIFIMDLKLGTNTYLDENGITKTYFKERKWQDDFEQAPTGTFSPNTATNLRFSPFNMMFRHGWQIMAGLTKYPTDYVRYGSSTANSQLKTKFRNDLPYTSNPSNIPSNGNEYSENGNIVNNELPKARFVGELVEFEHIVDFTINQLLQGFTIFNGEKVFNVYGLIEFKNEDNIIERGWLMNLKPNKEGKWQVLKFNKI